MERAPQDTGITHDTYDYDANCRRWPDVVGPVVFTILYGSTRWAAALDLYFY